MLYIILALTVKLVADVFVGLSLGWLILTVIDYIRNPNTTTSAFVFSAGATSAIIADFVLLVLPTLLTRG